MFLPSITVTPQQAARSYAGIESGDGVAAAGPRTANSQPGGGSGFGATLARALGGVVDAGHAADAQAMAAVAGHGSVTDVVTAVSKAELALQTTVAIRDRMVQAYQDIMRMPI